MAKTTIATKIAGGLGVAALAAAAAATYYFYGNKGKQHRRQITAWSKKAKEEMVQKIKQMKTFSKQAYDKAAKEVMTKYKQAKNVKPEELATLGREIQSHWNKISKDISALGKRKAAAR